MIKQLIKYGIQITIHTQILNVMELHILKVKCRNNQKPQLMMDKHEKTQKET